MDLLTLKTTVMLRGPKTATFSLYLLSWLSTSLSLGICLFVCFYQTNKGNGSIDCVPEIRVTKII